MISSGADNLDIKSNPYPTVKASSCENVLEENSCAEKENLEKMPLYPHSILKKASKTTAYPQFVKEEPLIDYDTDDEETREVSKNGCSSRTEKSQPSSSTFSSEDPSLDRPVAKPGNFNLSIIANSIIN